MVNVLNAAVGVAGLFKKPGGAGEPLDAAGAEAYKEGCEAVGAAAAAHGNKGNTAPAD